MHCGIDKGSRTKILMGSRNPNPEVNLCKERPTFSQLYIHNVLKLYRSKDQSRESI